MKKVNSDVAYAFIRKRILGGEYPPGLALTTEFLSGKIGVSRTPVREALCRLEADGLVSIQNRLGASVRKVGEEEFREMCDMRLALEGHAAGLCAQNHNEAQLREIRSALEAMRELTGQIIAADQEHPLIEALQDEDVRFHIAIITAAKNDLMKKEILRLSLIDRVVSGGGAPALLVKKERDARRPVAMASHEEIYDAIARRDVRAAKDAMNRHIQDILDERLRALGQQESGSQSRKLTEEELLYHA